MATASKVIGFNVACPMCHSEDDTVTIDLNDLAECRCTGCDETFTPADAVAKLAKQLDAWRRVDQWVGLAAIVLAE